MNKLALATAIAAATAFSTGAHAGPTSSITDLQLWLGAAQIEYPCPAASPTHVTIGGASNSTVTLTSTFCLNPGAPAPLIRVVLNLSSGNYVSGSGTTFDAGSISIDADTGSGWIPYSTIAVSPTAPVECLANVVGHLGTNTTAGLILEAGTFPAPGLWNTPLDENNALCVTTLLGQSAALFAHGSLSN
jgi:hypothetical protein